MVPAEIRDSSKSLVSCTYIPSILDLTDALVPRAQLDSSIRPTWFVHMDGEVPSLGLFPSRCLSRPSQLVVFTAILPMGVRTHFFQMVPPILEFCPMSLGGGIAADESRLFGTLFLIVPITLARVPFSLGCKPILRQLLVLRMLEVWKSHQKLWRPSCVVRMIPAR